ncbi:MAG: nucleotidyltransferase family protein, partial [Pseudomonadota bacterium]
RSVTVDLFLQSADLNTRIEQTAFSLNLLWDRMLQDNSLYIDEYPGSWCDVGSAEGIQEAETMLAHRNV